MVEGTKEASRRHWVRWLTLGGSVSFLLLVGASCAYDKNNPCGDDLEFDEDNNVCVCPAGTLYSPTGCIECGEHEILQGAECVCEEGYTRGTDNVCHEDMGSGGATSTSTSTTTSTTTAGESGAGGEGGDGAESTSTEGTSTTGSVPDCTVNDDCETNEICDAGACRIPDGFGAACTVPDDCADSEATFCDSFQMKCTVQGCTVSPDSCPVGYDCCDLSAFAFPVMCIPAGACTQ
ncbi:MAG TPA: hypothetical protein VFU02_02745 [Polyangiaceae bacterium]|nr:hypothetical protein [Polyangiaceae bacterium]